MEAIIEEIPQSLLYEEFGGRKYYRRGYRQVMLGLKTESDIMGSSILQGMVVQAIVFYLKSILPRKSYWVPTNEVGLHLGYKENLSGDILICEQEKLGNPWVENYFTTPPKFVIEVDIKIDPKDYDNALDTGSEMAYMTEKSEKLLDFGVEGVAWVLTKIQKTFLFRPGHRLEVFNWTEDVPLFDDYSLCVQIALEEDGISPPSV